MGVRLEEIHDLSRRDFLLKGFLKTISRQHTYYKIREPKILPHEKSENGPVQSTLRISVDFKV